MEGYCHKQQIYNKTRIQKFNFIFNHFIFTSFCSHCCTNNNIQCMHLFCPLWNTSRCSHNFCDCCTVPEQKSENIFITDVFQRTFKNGSFSPVYDCLYDNVFGENNFLCLVWKKFYIREHLSNSIYYHTMGTLGRRNRMAGIFGTIA